MSRAEALKVYCDNCRHHKVCGFVSRGIERNCPVLEDFSYGYEQAEKDIALTWEDVRLMHKISDDLPYMAEEDFYKEVLKRFNSKKQ